MARSTRQRAASRANLIKARAKRHRRPSKRTVRRVAKTAGIVGLVAGSAYVGSHNKKVHVASHTLASSTKNTVSPHRVRTKAFKKANIPHTPEAKAHANIRYRHSTGRTKGISEAEVMRRTGSYSAIRGKKITSMERSAAMKRYRKQTV